MALDCHAIKNELHSVATQAYALAMGLQNASPPGVDGGKPLNTVQYLLETAMQLQEISREID